MSSAPARTTTVDDPAEDSIPEPKKSFVQRAEAFVSRLSTKNNFWHKVCSLVWLPYAFRSGISIKRIDSKTFTAVLPFRRFNRNWYNAMAGAALLGNSEVAGGMFLFSACGSDYIVVCKEMRYRFLRPCLGPAVYHVVNAEDVQQKIDDGGEFNIDLEMEIRQQMQKRGREPRVGRCWITFHCTPKTMYRDRQDRVRRRGKDAPALETGSSAAGATRANTTTSTNVGSTAPATEPASSST